MRVPYIDLKEHYRRLKPEIDEAMQKVMASGRYIGGEEVEKFEERMARYLGVKHVVSCGNGYDALFLALKAFGVWDGDVVRADEYTHVSTHAAVEHCGARLVFDGPSNLAIPVHMNGRMRPIAGWMLDRVVEDACQALGASYKGKKAGTFGVMGCFSLHPMKVLGCAGDGGFIATSNSEYDEKLRELRNHGGGKGYGYNSRLDNLQAAILNVKMDYLDWFIGRRRWIASRYENGLRCEGKPPPPGNGDYFDVYSSYVLKAGPEMLDHLKSKDIECFSHIRSDCVSLPIYPEMPEEHIDYVIDAVNSF